MIPASPTDGFRGQIAMFRRSLDALGGPYARAEVIAIFGDTSISDLPARWSPHFARITVRHANPLDVAIDSYVAQAEARWSMVPEDCDIAIFCDADTLVVRPFDDLLALLTSSPGIAGSIAHYPPPVFEGQTPADLWRDLGREFVGIELSMPYRHTLAPPSWPDTRARCPFYVNFGFVAVPRADVETIASSLVGLRRRIATRLRDRFFATQIALTLAVHAAGLRQHAIDIRYNFPNDPAAETGHPQSLDDVRLIHYLRTTHFDRQAIFADATAFDAFLALRLSGSELVFQQRVRLLTDGRYPF